MTKSETPVAVCAVGEKAPCARSLRGVTAIAAGGNGLGSNSYALLQGGEVVDWGGGIEPRSEIFIPVTGYYRTAGLGNGTREPSDTPVAVCAPEETTPCARHLSGVKAIAAGGEQGWAIGPFPPFEPRPEVPGPAVPGPTHLQLEGGEPGAP